MGILQRGLEKKGKKRKNGKVVKNRREDEIFAKYD